MSANAEADEQSTTTCPTRSSSTLSDYLDGTLRRAPRGGGRGEDRVAIRAWKQTHDEMRETRDVISGRSRPRRPGDVRRGRHRDDPQAVGRPVLRAPDVRRPRAVRRAPDRRARRARRRRLSSCGRRRPARCKLKQPDDEHPARRRFADLRAVLSGSGETLGRIRRGLARHRGRLALIRGRRARLAASSRRHRSSGSRRTSAIASTAACSEAQNRRSGSRRSGGTYSRLSWRSVTSKNDALGGEQLAARRRSISARVDVAQVRAHELGLGLEPVLDEEPAEDQLGLDRHRVDVVRRCGAAAPGRR